MKFDGTQIQIGKGAQAQVFLYHDFAYKVYESSYPPQWIAFEKQQQKEINKLHLSPIKYYNTDDSHVIKMDFINGITLHKKMIENPSNKGFTLLADAFRLIHNTDTRQAKIPHLKDTATMEMQNPEKTKVLSIINKLSEKYPNTICHLDLHFQNIMLPQNQSDYIIIDWINTRLAPCVFDYARTYVIFQEFSKEVAEIYKQVIWTDIQNLGIYKEDFFIAVEACTIIRQQEKQ